MTETEKMLSGKIYDPSDKELAGQRKNAHRLSKDYNDTYDGEDKKRCKILKKLIPIIFQENPKYLLAFQ